MEAVTPNRAGFIRLFGSGAEGLQWLLGNEEKTRIPLRPPG